MIVGFGNDLRGEDGFGIEVVKQLQKYPLKNTKLISTFQLTPELALDLQEFDEIIFVDAAHSDTFDYVLACNLEQTTQNTLSHHISIQMIISILNSLYDSFPTYEVYSMLTNSYDFVKNKKKYNENIIKTVKFIKKL